MPGLAGAVQRVPDARLQTIFDNIVAPMRRGPGFKEESEVDRHGRWALGRVHLGVLQPEPQLSTVGVRVLFHGDLHNESELRAGLPATVAPPPGTNALVAALYRIHGITTANVLRGAFCCVVLDEERHQVVLINDFLGSYPLYWFRSEARFVFASELKAVLKDPSAPRSLDPRAVADYVQFGFVMGERTLAEGVQMVPAGATVTFDWSNGDCRISSYRRVADLFRSSGRSEPTPDALDRLDHSFQRAVQRTLAGGQSVGLSLSGGLDTRAILSAVDEQGGPLATYTLGVKGCADDVIADKLARLTSAKHRFFELDASYLSEFLPNVARMVSLTDGMYLSHGLTEMLALNFLQGSDFSVLLRGHCGELAKTSLAWPFHTDEAVSNMTTRDELIPYLLRRLDYIGRGAEGLFTPDWSARMDGAARQSLRESLDGLELHPAELCSYLYLQEQHRRFTVPSLELFRNTVEVRLPFADEDFLTDLFASPAALRSGTVIHKALIGGKLLRVRNSNTGAPAGASPLVESVLDKFNTIFKRLNVYGYRHYHNFDKWMKDQLLASVESVLLDPATIQRGMLHEPTLRRLIEATRSGAADHGYLFQVLLILELWQRENLQ